MEENIVSYVENSISTAPDRLRSNVVNSNGRMLFHRWAFYRLRKLVDEFMGGKRENRWVILPGLRGTGKTTLLSQIYFHLGVKGVPQRNILYTSLDKVTKILHSNLHEVVSTYEGFIGKNLESIDEPVFLLVDETHYDKEWGITFKTIFDRTKKVFTIATGSSSLALQTSSDIARRAQVERLFPLEFSEYIMLKHRTLPTRSLKERIKDIMLLSKNAEEVFNGLENLKDEVNNYWSKIKPFELETYLKVGTLPFSIPLTRESDVYQRIVTILEKVIGEDIPALRPFDKKTLGKIWNLLLLFSVSERVSYPSICSKLGVSEPTLSTVIETLKKAEVIYPVRPYGSVGKMVRKTPKYKFIAPVIKSSLLWHVGKLTSTPELYGSLLEDVVCLYLYKMSEINGYISIFHDARKGGADFIIVNSADDSKFIVEVGYGNKGVRQIKNSMERINAKYGILISKESLDIKENVVIIPRKIFLLS